MFRDIRLDPRISNDAHGGPTFNTTIVELGAGNEWSNSNWSLARREWSVNFVTRVTDEKFQNLLAFFLGCKGKAHSFRFKDWSDYSERGGVGYVKKIGTKYYLYKRYNEWSERRIWLPRIHTFEFQSSFVASSGNNANIDPLTGELISGNPVEGDLWYGEYDIECRFDTDKMDYRVRSDGIVEWNGVPVIEMIKA